MYAKTNFKAIKLLTKAQSNDNRCLLLICSFVCLLKVFSEFLHFPTTKGSGKCLYLKS